MDYLLTYSQVFLYIYCPYLVQKIKLINGKCMAKAKSGSNKVFPRILLSLLGAGFILWGTSTIALGIFGKRTTAVITNVRREQGERNEAIRGRYTYIISYRFKLPDGKTVDGFTRKIGDSVYLKADGKTVRAVRYFRSLPFINALEDDAKSPAGSLIIIAVGVFLIYIINKGKKKTIRKRA
jgi:hypothetical protein